MSMMGLFAWRLGDTIKHHGQRGRTAKVPPAMEFAYVAEALTPWTMLFTHIIKLTCASAILALDVVVYSQRKEYQSLVGLGLDIALSYVGLSRLSSLLTSTVPILGPKRTHPARG
ncbi:hypothetical protein UVI_02009910 [Ustilaginoidea virens]|uniref:Uncharacterized protein n=1 Tax=Ustilaginoidea virens TaxID=1159556 RepID=A0A1B5L4D2_USTVR|nr:hypothetical protein UVI_02009910 [Ustilaginoidea virens]